MKDGCNINNVILKHLKGTDIINESENNIAYTNETCKTVSSAIRKNLNKVDDYAMWENCVCCKLMIRKSEKSTFKLILNLRLLIL